MKKWIFVFFLFIIFSNLCFANEKIVDDFPFSLSDYTFGKDLDPDIAICEIIRPEGITGTTKISGKDAKWLFVHDGRLFIKKKFIKDVLRKSAIQFDLNLQRGRKTFLKQSFTLLRNNFYQNRVIAHRGAWENTGLPQNSIAALKAAITLGCFGSETDVHMTADSALVINHDPVWASLNVQKNILTDLRKTKLSNGENLPLLSDFLTAIKDQTGTHLILELKPSERGREWADATVKKVIQTVREMQAQAWIIYIGFDYEMCKEILRLEPLANVQYLNGDKSPEQLKQDGIKGADYHYSVFQRRPEWIASAKRNNIDLNAWTVNDAKIMDWLLANDFDFITTNEPELLFKEIKKSPTQKGWTLKWSDEFNYKGLPDSSKWNYEVGDNGWGNNEKQFYTHADTSNAVVRNGALSIIVRKENDAYTSARLLTKGKADWKYGRIEMSAKLPAGRGLWPAFWMLAKDVEKVPWPTCGEIDIMEHVGYDKDSVLATVHTGSYNHIKGTQKGNKVFIKNPYTEFHTYAIEWSAEKIDFLLDDTLYNRFINEHKTVEEWPFDQPFYLLLNVAVGGNLGGQKGIDDSVFPATYEIDYVRVYQ